MDGLQRYECSKLCFMLQKGDSSMSKSSDEMEIEEAERALVAKPVASRPSSSSFLSFSELLAGVINDAPWETSNEVAVAVIRPKKVRLKPTVNRSLLAYALVVAPPVEPSRTAETSDSAKEAVKSDSKPTVIYKPTAKVVSKLTLSILENMGDFSNAQQRVLVAPAPAIGWNQTMEKTISSRPQLISSNPSPSTKPNRAIIEPSKVVTDDDRKALASPAITYRPSYDGYNWRKYGQKQVKGTEYPRSYYKCTHPNCPVKKKVERSLDSQIAEIVYKGEHNHPKPQPPKRGGSTSSAPHGNAAAQEAKPERLETTVENNQGLQGYNEQAGMVVADNSRGLSQDHDEGNKGIVEAVEEDPRSKRRKCENPPSEAGNVAADRAQQSQAAETDMAGDGFRWRKYGQKVVKGNPYPRSYYRCTSLQCNVRKYVERASEDPRAFITTYEGHHNHEMPLRSSSVAVREADPGATTSKDNSKPNCL
ncbi:hypothetical protein SAY86_005284 [Trapa natans]|uniref:WRKY domain-containing protein n=1 Tax=Trapa natans TaxID=22666 RepID=A0AAN7QT93_TRANT|nr:hypothetical protein SAY86_005284 [Trapa natans]